MKLRSKPYRILFTASFAITFSQSAMATDILWSGATTGTLDWNNGMFTNSTTDRADLRVDWTSTPTINLSAPTTTNGVLFDDTGATSDTTLTIYNGGTATNTLTLGGTAPSLDVAVTTLTISANLAGTAGFTKSGGGVLALSGSNTGFSGNVVISGGTLQLTSGGNTLNNSNLVQVNSAATLRVNNSSTIAGLNDNAGSGGSVTNSSGGGKALTIGGSGSYRFNGDFTTGGSNKVGLVVSSTAGTQTLGGNNTVNTGYQSVTGNGGTLVFAKQNSIFQGLSAGAVVNSNTAANSGINVSLGGAVALGVGDSASGYFDSAAIGTFLDASHMGASTNSTGFRNNSILGFDTTNATSGTFTYSTALTNIGSSTGIGFAKLGSGSLVLDVANTYTGVTQVRAGTLQIGAGSTTGSIGSSGDITISSGATLAFNRSDTTLSVANKITGGGSVSQNGAGTITLTATTSDYSGGTNINGGILVARVGSIGSGDVNLNSGGKQFKPSNSDFSISNNIALASGAVGVNGQGLIDTDTNVDAVLNGTISISGSPTDTGAGHFGSSSGGSLTVNGTITSSVAVEWRRNHGVFSNGGTGYTNFKIRSGDVKLGGDNGLATTAAVALGGDGNAVLDLNGYNQSLVGLTKGANGATVTNNGTADALLTTTGTSSFGGDIQDGAKKVALTVNGGQLTLSGTNNTYTGETTVSSGKLIVDGNISTSITTVNGGILGGSGTIGAALTVNSGAFLSPGNSPGNLTLNSGLTMAGTYTWELGALSTSNPGTDFDILTITAGNADITGAALGLNLGAFAPSADPFWAINQTWSGILNNTGAGSLTGTFAAIDNSQWSSLGTFSTGNVGNDVNLVWTAVPEPNAAALVGGLGMLALLRRRRA